ncbi:MAG: YbhN family protein [Promethearchaeota archaeon]
MKTSSETAVEETKISLRKVFDKKTLFLLSFALIMLLIYLYLEDVSLTKIIENFSQINPIILFLGAASTFIAVLFDTLAWKILLGISSIRPSVPSIYRIQLASFSYGLLIPSAGAIETIMRIALGTQEFVNEKEHRNATSGELLSSVVAHRLCGLLVFIPISTFVAYALLRYFSDIYKEITGQPLTNDMAISFTLIISSLAILVIIFFILIAKTPTTVKKIVLLIFKGLYPFPLIGNAAKNAVEPSKKIVDDFSIQFKFLAQNKSLTLVTLVLSFFSQITHWIAIFLILHSIGIPILLDQVVAVNFLGGTIDAIPIGIPGMAGLKEISLTVFLENIPGWVLPPTEKLEKAATGAILVQLVKFYFLIIVGILVYIAGKTRVTSQDLKEGNL